MLDQAARLAAAVVVAFVGVLFLKSQRRTLVSWVARIAVGVPALLIVLWLVIVSIPYPRDPGFPTFTIVATAILLAGIAVDELVGADIRRALGI